MARWWEVWSHSAGVPPLPSFLSGCDCLRDSSHYCLPATYARQRRRGGRRCAFFRPPNAGAIGTRGDLLLRPTRRGRNVRLERRLLKRPLETGPGFAAAGYAVFSLDDGLRTPLRRPLYSARRFHPHGSSLWSPCGRRPRGGAGCRAARGRARRFRQRRGGLLHRIPHGPQRGGPHRRNGPRSRPSCRLDRRIYGVLIGTSGYRVRRRIGWDSVEHCT